MMMFVLLYIGYVSAVVVLVFAYFTAGFVFDDVRGNVALFAIVFAIVAASSYWVLDIIPRRLFAYIDELEQKRYVNKIDLFICGVFGGLFSLLGFLFLYKLLSSEVMVAFLVFSPVSAIFLLAVLVWFRKRKLFK